MNYKLVVLMALILIVACGKKNIVTNKVSHGTGNGNGRIDNSMNEISSDNDHHLISNFMLVNQNDKWPVPPSSTSKDPSRPKTVPLGEYAIFRVWLDTPAGEVKAPKPSPKPLTAATAPVAAVTGKSVKKTYHYFYEKFVSCSDGPLKTKSQIVDHDEGSGDLTFTQGSPIELPKIGTILVHTHNKTEPVSYAVLTLSTPIGAKAKSFRLNHWSSQVTVAQMQQIHGAFDPASVMQKKHDELFNEVASSCADAKIINPIYADHIKPDDASTSAPGGGAGLNAIYGNDVEPPAPPTSETDPNRNG